MASIAESLGNEELLSSPDLQTLQNELDIVVRNLARIQRWVYVLVQREDQKNSTQLSQIDALEAELAQLRAQNEKLMSADLSRKQEIDGVLDARDAAFRKLHHTGQVIKDLLDELRITPKDAISVNLGEDDAHKSHASRSARTPTDGGRKHARTIPPEHISEIPRGEEPDNSSDGPSEDTIRLGDAPLMHPKASRLPGQEGTEPQASTSKTPDRMAEPVSSHIEGDSRSGGKLSPLITQDSNSSSLSVPFEGSTPSSSIQTSKPPASTLLSCGPISWAQLSKRLGFDEETIASLQSLEMTSELCLRLQIVGDKAFVYDSIILETPSSSLVIDWALKSTNDTIERYILDAPEILHTFFFPVKRKNWYYIGAHRWSLVELRDVWKTLNARSKDVVATKLKARTQYLVNEKAIAQMIEEGELQQLAVKISGAGLLSMSQELSSKMGYKRGK